MAGASTQAFRTEMADGYRLDEPAITLGSPMLGLDAKAGTGKGPRVHLWIDAVWVQASASAPAPRSSPRSIRRASAGRRETATSP
jgi:hypothetical protein